jgi:transposase
MSCRRRWTAQEKGRIVAETLNAGVAVAEIARRHDMSSQHLFNWIRAAKEGRLALPADEGAAPLFRRNSIASRVSIHLSRWR